MRFRQLLKAWVTNKPPVYAVPPPNVNLDLVFAVPDNEPWWMAVHQLIDEAERETVDGARSRTANTNLCIAAIGASEGVDLIRQKLKDKRELALRQTGGQGAIQKNRQRSVSGTERQEV
jgi:hypothetical protein